MEFFGNDGVDFFVVQISVFLEWEVDVFENGY